MEISEFEGDLKTFNLFKIDLIVWKYNISNDTYEKICKFKIDLIVWK